jgi:hypothetical protein
VERIFTWPLFAITYLAIALPVIWLVWTTTRSWWWRSGIVLLFFPLILVWDIAPGWLYFNYLCRSAGLTIYRAVEEIEGVVVDEEPHPAHGCGASCRTLLSRNEYRYVEVDVQQPRIQYFYASEVGPHRFTLAPIDSPECDVYKLGRRHAGLSTVRDDRLPSGYCIAGQRVTKLSAPYIYVRYEHADVNRLFYMEKYETYVAERNGGEVLGRVVQHAFGGGWLATNLGFGRQYPYECPSRQNYFDLRRDLSARILKSTPSEADSVGERR